MRNKVFSNYYRCFFINQVTFDSERTSYKYLDTGKVTLSEGNVACEGGELKIGGKKHSNIVEFVTIEYSVLTVKVTKANG